MIAAGPSYVCSWQKQCRMILAGTDTSWTRSAPGWGDAQLHRPADGQAAPGVPSCGPAGPGTSARIARQPIAVGTSSAMAWQGHAVASRRHVASAA